MLRKCRAWSRRTFKRGAIETAKSKDTPPPPYVELPDPITTRPQSPRPQPPRPQPPQPQSPRRQSPRQKTIETRPNVNVADLILNIAEQAGPRLTARDIQMIALGAELAATT